MKRTSLPLVATMTAALLLVPATGAHAAVSAKDAPNEKDIVKVFPALAGGTFETTKAKKISVPGKECGVNATQKGKSVAVTGISTEGRNIVVAGVSDLGSKAKAKGYMAKFKKFVKQCSSYTEPTTGATVTLKLAKAPKLGQQAIAIVQETSVMGITSHGASIVILQGKRISTVGAVDPAPIATSSITKLAKVAAKKMK